MKELEYTDTSYFIQENEVDTSWKNNLSKEYNQYRIRWKEATEEFKVFDFPLCLEVESSYSCNLKCPMCPRFAATTPKSGNLSLEKFNLLMDECKNRLDSLFLDHGGEALMNKHLPLFVKKCKDANILDIMLSTNGTLLTSEISNSLILNGLTKINFSIDANSDKVYNITRPGGSFNQVIQNIENFLSIKKELRYNLPRTRVSFIVQDANKNEIKDFYSYWKDKVNMITYQKMKDFNTILSDNNENVIDKTYKFKCTQVFTNLMIDNTGGIYMCNFDYNHEYKLGTIGENTIEECWNSKTMKDIRELHSKGEWHKHPLCSKCVSGCI